MTCIITHDNFYEIITALHFLEKSAQKTQKTRKTQKHKNTKIQKHENCKNQNTICFR
uniref:Uncharacterized protein n=1 Tax=viral metagenome TaxID=1070528 RepID=A0A6C0IHQ1_9ZZZZ